MCGFVCLWKTGDEALASAMIDRIAHRGPDAVAVQRHERSPAIMAHCRLSIIGTENGAQPICEGDDMLVVNGEIYNYADLRKILGEDLFRTDSDSETVLHLFRTGDPRWVSRLDGMFAFVLATPERVIAGRDPLGIKPLYVAHLGEGLAFASEIKAFDGLPVTSLRSVGPGETFDSLHGRRLWHRRSAGVAREAESENDPAAVAGELRLMLEEAVRRWMVADVEVGCFLSGGLDSSVIAALAARISPHTLKTFAVGLEGSPDLAAARRVARHIGSDHSEHAFTADEVAAALPHVIYHLESADVDLVRSAVPTHFAARLARRKVKTLLTGEGADELFAGYAYHHAYVDRPRELADELSRSLGTMHNINLQRVDRLTMAEGLEARTPFLDQTLIAFAQTIPATLKLRRRDASDVAGDGTTIEKWILRKACEDLLPGDVVWRKKAQFDEGSGAVETLAAVISKAIGLDGPVEREQEAAFYDRLVREQYADPGLVFENAGAWAANRV